MVHQIIHQRKVTKNKQLEDSLNSWPFSLCSAAYQYQTLLFLIHFSPPTAAGINSV